jgi:nucleotide-binding universal stress UspA family protein
MQPLQAKAEVALRHILVATDFSAASGSALITALGIARRYGSKVILAHVFRPEAYHSLAPEARQRALDDAWRDAQRQMMDQLIAGRLSGVANEVVVETGDEIWPVLARMVRERHIDLLVVGTRGRTGVAKLLMGSAAEDIFRQAPCPVMTVGPKLAGKRALEGAARILFATGFSGHSLAAGGYALSLAQHNEATLILLHVITTPVDAAARDHARREAKEKLHALIPADLKLSCRPEYVVEFGGAAECILSATEKHHADVIVLGIRQSEGFARRMKWATAYEVVRHAPCPVLTVRSPD